MRLHILNDLHLEFARWPREIDLNAIDADVTVLAGDIGVGLGGVTWALAAFRRPVIYILGNHEYFGQRLMPELLAAARTKCRGTHVHLLENDAVVIEGVRFLGCTLWTDFALFEEEERNVRAMEVAGLMMGDFLRILGGRGDGGYGKNKLIPFPAADGDRPAPGEPRLAGDGALQAPRRADRGGDASCAEREKPHLPRALLAAGLGLRVESGSSDGRGAGAAVGAWAYAPGDGLRGHGDEGSEQSAGVCAGGERWWVIQA